MMLITQIASSAPASTVSKMLIFRSAFPMILFVLTRGGLFCPHRTFRCKITNYSSNGKGKLNHLFGNR